MKTLKQQLQEIGHLDVTDTGHALEAVKEWLEQKRIVKPKQKGKVILYSEWEFFHNLTIDELLEELKQSSSVCKNRKGEKL